MCPKWRVLSASVTGTVHERLDVPCQDFNLWEVTPEGILLCAVADGAGSASLGHIGAQIAATSALKFLSRKAQKLLALTDDKIRIELLDIIQDVKSSIESEAGKYNANPRELATTLILVVAGYQFIAVAHIGDGAVVVKDGGELFALSKPETREFVNETTFVISPKVLYEVNICILRSNFKYISIISDGLQMLALKMPEGIPYVPFFSPLFEFISKVDDEKKAGEELIAFLRSERVKNRTDDDMTLLLAYIAD